MASDREAQEAKVASVQAIVSWSLVGAKERAEMLGRLGNGNEVFSLDDLLLFWADECPEILQMLLKAGADKYWPDPEEEHAPTPNRGNLERLKQAHQRMDNSPQAILKRMAQS